MSDPFPSWSDFAREPAASLRRHQWDGLAGLWCPELGPSGGRLFDCSGRMRHGTAVNNPTWNVGRNGWMLSLSAGSSQYVDCGVVPEFGSTQHLSIATWMELSSGNIMAVGAPGNYTQRFEILFDGSTIYFTLDGYYPASACGSGLHYIAMVFDGTLGSKAIRGYVDGRLAVEGGGPSTTAPISQLGTFYLGQGSGGRYSTGRIGLTAVFGRSLQLDEIAQLYADPLGMLRPWRKPRLSCLGGIGGPYRMDARQIYQPGMAAGDLFLAGQTAGQING
jgi:hypothetical protein